MSNRFDHIKTPTKRRVNPDSVGAVSQCETKLKPNQIQISRKAYNTLMCLLATVQETPETPYGVYIANGTKRSLQLQVKELFTHD